jgi:hypothetical protein
VELLLHSHNTPSWRGAQLKHRDNFTFTFTFTFKEKCLENTERVYQRITKIKYNPACKGDAGRTRKRLIEKFLI